MEIEDKDLGKIQLIANVRARRVIARVRQGVLQLTHPSFMSQKEIAKTIEKLKPQLQLLLDKSIPQTLFTATTVLQTLTFSLQIRETELSKFYSQLENGSLVISCPKQTDYSQLAVQDYIRKLIEAALRSEANRILPTKLDALAKIHGFKYSQLKINKSKTRWGSCSSSKCINLSYSCLLLPEYLLDFIILHELCHTLEMNHGEHFWALLDKVSGGEAKAYTAALKKYRTRF